MEMKDDSGVSVHAPKQDEADSSVVASSNPVVFQCSQCDAIVGDSTSWVSANKIMRTITLGRITSKVGVKSAIEVSQSGIDKGSTFLPIYCINCNEVLGKQYLASPPELDYIRGSFTLHVEKLNSYEVGSAEARGNSDLADMVNVPSPGYLMARMNKMQFLIVSMNDRIKNLEACLANGESTVQHLDNTNRQQFTHGETESVSSTDNFSTRPRTDSFGSAVTDMDSLQEENIGGGRQERFPSRQINDENFERTLEQQTRKIDRNNDLLPKERLTRRGVRSDAGSIRQFNQRSGQKEPCTNTMTDGNQRGIYKDVDIEDNENEQRNEQRNIGKRGRTARPETDGKKVGNERSGEQSATALQGIITKALQSQNKDSPRPGRSNVNQQGRNANHEGNDGFTSPNEKVGRRSLSRNRPVMETWPSPGIERRESKKRKMFDPNDSQ
ncbi:uncharacterized protein LOC123551944 [Mercenaria mercenaria]|uniref:uncharacterized protein LOC123551944 n=1 Tax=Mercenaria mercenaria TaxID=6596 RepID=UPI00234F6A41|nr:uncharacterized protein LOC123551944 [Mercenaria mercenaria]